MRTIVGGGEGNCIHVLFVLQWQVDYFIGRIFCLLVRSNWKRRENKFCIHYNLQINLSKDKEIQGTWHDLIKRQSQ